MPLKTLPRKQLGQLFNGKLRGIHLIAIFNLPTNKLKRKEITKLHQQSANTMQQLRSQNDAQV